MPVVADNWGAHFDDCVFDLELCMRNLELVRIHEIRNERVDHVAELESFTVDLEAWRPNVDEFLDDVRLKMLRLTKQWDRAIMETPSHPVSSRCLSQSPSPPAGPSIDWPKGHRVESTTQEANYGSVTTIVPTSANGTCSYSLLSSSIQPQLMHRPLPPPVPPNPLPPPNPNPPSPPNPQPQLNSPLTNFHSDHHNPHS